MHRSGIQVSSELRQAFEQACSEGVGVLKYQIDGESFVQRATGGNGGDLESNFNTGRDMLDDREPSYLLLRKEDRFILVSYCPENANVRDKMLYSSSRSSLKEGLGRQKVLDDHFCSEKNECSLKDYEHSTQNAPEDVMTLNEIEHRDAHIDAMKSQQTVKLAAMQDVPIKITESTSKNFTAFHNGNAQALLLQLDMNSEALTSKVEAKTSTNNLSELLPRKEPMFILYRYPHTNDNGEKKEVILFFYYCPDVAIPKQKMFYSSTKSMVLKVAKVKHIHVDRNIEISEPKEMNDNNIMTEIYPKVHVKKTFAKPKRQGKGQNRVRSKFDASKTVH